MADPFHLAGGEGERLAFSGAEFLVKASAETTGGAFSIIEEQHPLDTPRHVHEREDELFVVLEGWHVFIVGDREFSAGPGDAVFAPHGVPHEHRRAVQREGRFLTLVSPPGFEGFFRELAEAERRGDSMPDAYTRVSETYGVTWVRAEESP
jgi:mannose-6-phosphate isomerase-like protein (cupin superfamily)